ncbi:hypothetical protein CYY_007657 [Polysphondylium violaceum]|uniref:Tetratricopeptide-like helical domain-containing protein n=1 Tax=Polysphondylium violaceum TaxID=133409 RepID=A0A8J4PWY3_9MYCE|nr:hypothetical protein CYY_007657 [Polysphondylium violaceum]
MNSIFLSSFRCTTSKRVYGVSKYTHSLSITNHSINRLFSSGAKRQECQMLKARFFSNNRLQKDSINLISDSPSLKELQEKLDTQYHSMIDQALEEFKLKQLESAIQILSNAILLCNNKPDAYILRGDIKSEFRNTLNLHINDPIQDYLWGVQLLPTKQRSDIFYSISRLLTKNCFEKEMEQYLDRAIECDAKDHYLYEKIILGCSKGKLDQVMDICKKLVNENNSYGVLALAMMALNQKNHKKAIEIVQTIIDSTDPTIVTRENERQNQQKFGKLYHNRLFICKDGLTRILEKTENDAHILFHAYMCLGIITVDKGDIRKAYEFYKKSIDYAPFIYSIRSYMANLMNQLGEYQEAAKHCSICLDFDPELESFYTLDALKERAFSYYGMGEDDKAIGDILHLLGILAQSRISLELVKFRSEILEIAIIRFGQSIQLAKAICRKQFNIDQMISQLDSSNILSRDPKNVQQLLSHASIYLGVYHFISESIRNGLVVVDPKDQEASDSIMYRESFFIFLIQFLNDSLYLNYKNNYSDQSPKEDTEESLIDLISQLPFQESKQDANRQEQLETIRVLYQNVISHMNKVDE